MPIRFSRLIGRPFAVLVLSSLLFGQERPVPEYLNAAYVYDGASRDPAQVTAAGSRLDGLVPPMFGAASGCPCASGKLLDPKRANAKPAAKAKVFGYGWIKGMYEFPGLRSQVRFPANHKVVFDFKAPAGLDPQSLIGIVRLTPQKGSSRDRADAIQRLHGTRWRQEQRG